MNESDLIKQQDRAAKAQMLLDNPLLNETLDAIEQEIVKKWIECPIRDKEGKEELWKLVKTKKKFESLLKGYIETGKLASHDLKKSKISRLFG